MDRRALAAQAVNVFASFEPEPGLKFDKIYEVYSQRFRREDLGDEKFDAKVMPAGYLLNPKPAHAFVYVCTIQRMAINLFGRQTAFALGDEEDRWRSFSIAEVKERDFKLDSFKWLKEESLEDADDLPEPEELATDAMSELEGAVGELNAVLALLENGNGK